MLLDTSSSFTAILYFPSSFPLLSFAFLFFFITQVYFSVLYFTLLSFAFLFFLLHKFTSLFPLLSDLLYRRCFMLVHKSLLAIITLKVHRGSSIVVIFDHFLQEVENMRNRSKKLDF